MHGSASAQATALGLRTALHWAVYGVRSVTAL